MDAKQRARVDELLTDFPHTQKDQGTLVLTPLDGPQAEMITPDDENAALAFPVHVIPTARAERLELAVEKALTIEVKDQASYLSASEGLKHLEKEIQAQEEYVTELRRPYSERANRISKMSKDGLVLALRGVAEFKGKIGKFLTEEETERQRQLAAQREAQAKAEAEQRRIDEAKRKEIERQQMELEEAKRRAERLQFEAQERERQAVEEMEAAGATAAAKVKLAKQLEENAERDRQAEIARLELEEAERKLQAEMVAPVVTVQAEVVRVAAAVTGGAQLKKVPVIKDVDLAQLPLAYRAYDEKKILKHLADGITIPGVTFTMEFDLKSNRKAIK